MAKLKEIFTSLYQFKHQQWGNLLIAFDEKQLDLKLAPALIECHFDACDPSEDWEKLVRNKEYKILKITPASLKVQKHMHQLAQEMGVYGNEIVKNHYYYQLYCLKSQALLVYSQGGKIWEAGVCLQQLRVDQVKILIQRFLSLTLFKQGVLGFWGRYENAELYLENQTQSEGNVVYIDLKRQLILDHREMHQLSWGMKLVRHHSSYSGDDVKLTPEQVMSYLLMGTTFLQNHHLYQQSLKKNCLQLAKIVQGVGRAVPAVSSSSLELAA